MTLQDKVGSWSLLLKKSFATKNYWLLFCLTCLLSLLSWITTKSNNINALYMVINVITKDSTIVWVSIVLRGTVWDDCGWCFDMTPGLKLLTIKCIINVQVLLLYGFKKRLKVDSSGGGDFIFSNAHAYLFSHHFKTHKSGELTFISSKISLLLRQILITFVLFLHL